MQNNLYLYPNLVSVRKSCFTQHELAELIGISQQEISRYERGEIKAPINYIQDVADACNVSVDYILGRTVETTNMISYEESKLINLFKMLSDGNKERLLERAEALLEMQNDK